MDRINAQGLPRDQLLFALTQRRIVRQARKEDACLLCRQERVNEAGLCEYCIAILDEDEMKLAERWMNGSGP